MPKEAVPFWVGLPIALFALAVLVAFKPSRVVLWLLKPALNDKGDALSLGRTCLCYWFAVQGWFILRHPAFFMNLQWPPAIVIVFSDLFLLTYCFGNKPWTRELGLRVADRMSIGGAAGQVLALATGAPGAKVEASVTSEAEEPDPGAKEQAG